MGCACMKTDVVVKNHGLNDRKCAYLVEKNDSKLDSGKLSSNNGKMKLIYLDVLLNRNIIDKKQSSILNVKSNEYSSSSQSKKSSHKNENLANNNIQNDNNNNRNSINRRSSQSNNNNRVVSGFSNSNFDINAFLFNEIYGRGANREVAFTNNLNARNVSNTNLELFLQSKNDPGFNFPELGEGLKSMKGYVSNISKEDLQKKRVEFWETRVQGNPQTWEFLRNICENMTDVDENLISFLEAVEVKPYKDCINITYDSQGFLYEIPNYCIHSPTIYQIKRPKKQIQPEEELINIIIRKESVLISLGVLNTLSIFQLKEKICECIKQTNNDLNLEVIKMRLFFGGKELLDDKEIWEYNIKENSNILVMYKAE